MRNAAKTTDSVMSPVGKRFVLGVPNALGEFVIVIGETRWRIDGSGIRPGDRVDVIAVEGDSLKVQPSSAA